jgi:uncharacterized membrane protein
MADFTGTTTVDAADDVLFAYVSDVHNLPKYFARMTSAEPGEGNEVRTTAALPDGSRVEGRAWFEVTDETRHLAWGSEGENGYHGYLDVRAVGDDRSEVEVHIHTERVTEDTDGSIQGGIDETLAALKQLVERAGALDS